MTIVPNRKRQAAKKGEENDMQTAETNEARKWLSVQEVQEILGLGSTKTYQLVASGEVPSVRIGRAIRINRKELDCWLEDQRYLSTVQSSSR